MLIQLAWFLGGLAVLALGAECFVRGSSAMALRLGISPFVVGLVVVGFGTSTPELAVNLSAALAGTTDIALGNVVGSNIANLGLILGVAALVAPLAVHARMLRVEVPLTIATGLALLGLGADGTIGRVDGVVLMLGFAGFLWSLLRVARVEAPDVKHDVAETARQPQPVWRAIALVAAGLGGLLLGADLMVDAAVAIARSSGLSELTIGLTVVAVGTSLPELAAAVLAARRGLSDLAIGNVLGSCIYNVLMILGLTAVVRPLPVAPSMLAFDLPVLIVLSALCWPAMRVRMRLGRAGGAALLLAYAAIVAWQLHGAGEGGAP